MENILIKTCETGNVEEVKKLLEAGVELHTRRLIGVESSDGESFVGVRVTPLLAAICHKHKELVDYLLSVGAEVSVDAFVNACDFLPECIEELLAHGANVNEETEYGMVGLSNAIVSGNFDTVKKLVSLGADVNAGTVPPLEWAGIYGHQDIAEFLVASGAKPLTEAEKEGMKNMRQFLGIEQG